LESGRQLDLKPPNLRQCVVQTEIVSSRRKTAFMLLGSLSFVAIAFLLPGPPDRKLFWSGVFFSVCSAVFVALLLRPQRLLLDHEGVTLSGGLLRAPTKIGWRDIDKFFVVSIRPGASMIGFNYNPSAMNKPRGAAFARRIAGADGAISGVWPGSKTALVDQLNTYRERALKDTDV
jgi:hypothetical protein